MPGAAARRQVLGIACWRRARPGCWSCESAGRATCTSCRCRQRAARRRLRVARVDQRRSERAPTAYARAQAPPNETPFCCMSRPSKPAAATALEAELRELETQIQRIETVYLSRCGANLVQGEGGAAGPAPRAAAAAARRPSVSPPASVSARLGQRGALGGARAIRAIRQLALAGAPRRRRAPASPRRPPPRARAQPAVCARALRRLPQRVFSLSSVTSPLGDKTPFPPAEKLIPPGRVIIVIHKSHKKKT